MKIKEFFIHQGWAIGFAEVRRYLDSGKVFLNGYGLTSVDDNLILHDGDSIQFGKREVIYHA